MFSKNTYLLHQSDSPNSLHSRASTSVVGLNGNEIFLSHHPDMLSGHFLTAAAPPVVVEPAVLYNQDANHGLNGDPPKTAKKDRHSKIYTAQGPRDRRVRLSIGVARKFFDLQEMLGVDKPSKTLDWLLTKSRTAIKHLVSTKQQGSKSTVISSLSECEENNCTGESFFDNSLKKKADIKGKSAMNNKKNKGAKDLQQQAALNLAKESRVKARARARERTREKMCIKQQQINNGGYELNPNCSIPIQYMNNQLEVCKIHCPQAYEAANQQDLVQGSVVNKRKAKHPSIFGFQPNYNIPSSYNVTENWDISNYASQSSICAILDQHKFNNSSSNN